MNCRIIDLEQGSPEWLDFRKGKIGASMVASCVGIKGAFNSKEEARDIILGLKEVYQNKAMKKGNDYEALIRARVEFLHSVSITPIVLQSLENEMFIASLDGIDQNGVVYEFNIRKMSMILSKEIKSQVINTTLKCNFNSISVVKKNAFL